MVNYDVSSIIHSMGIRLFKDTNFLLESFYGSDFLGMGTELSKNVHETLENITKELGLLLFRLYFVLISINFYLQRKRKAALEQSNILKKIKQKF